MLIAPYPELGLVAMDGPDDPEPSLVVESGRVVEIDGRREDEFDVLDAFIARRGIDLEAAAEAAVLADGELARRLVDVDHSRDELVRLSRGLTPARLARVVSSLDPVEMMFALKKLRARRAPANQAHVTNLKESPALLAADAAEAAARGFAELETTVGVSRYAPLNAIALLVGSQTGRPGVMTQCAVEERRNLAAGHPGPRDVRGDAVRVRHGAGVRGRRRHAVVESVSRVRVCVARREGPLHVRRRFRGAHGSRAGKVDALSRGAMPRRGSRRRLARGAERVDLVRRARAGGARGNAGDSRGEPAGRLARSRGGVGQRRHRVALGGAQDGEAHGAAAARHRLRHVRVLDHAPQGQHVRRRQLRRGRPRRVADGAARLAGGRGHRAARRGVGARRPRAGSTCRAGGVRGSRFPRDLRYRGRGGDVRLFERRSSRSRPGSGRGRRRPGAHRSCFRPRCRPRARRRRVRGHRRCDHRHATPAGLRRLSPDLGRDRRGLGRELGSQRPQPVLRARARATCWTRERWQLLQALPQTLDPRDFDEERRRGAGRRRAACCQDRERTGRSGDRRRPGVRRRDPADDQRARRTPTSSPRSRRAFARLEGQPRLVRVQAGPPTSPSSATTARRSPGRASRSASSRRERR